jgi:pre-60S factor REI1
MEGATETPTPKGSSLTCISCRLLFDTTKEQRIHYKSDLHRFNLKRKVAKLPPVTNEAFEQKVQSN